MTSNKYNVSRFRLALITIKNNVNDILKTVFHKESLLFIVGVVLQTITIILTICSDMTPVS